MARPTRATINLQAVRDNYQLACTLAPQSQTMAIVKANAYGHGAIPVAKALADLAPAYGVASIEEATELRQAGIQQPILLLGGAFSHDEIAVAEANNFWLMVENPQQKEALLNANVKQPITVWIGVDTGMHRLGFAPEQVPALHADLQASANVSDGIVICSHFACADELDHQLTRQQLERMAVATHGLKAPTSLANSAALLGSPDAHRDWNRPGIMLYGCSPFSHPHPHAEPLKPAITLSSQVISLREIGIGETVGYSGIWQATRPTTIATVAIGYGDGYPRTTPSGTPVLINGQQCPLAGRVSMDSITVDVTDLPQVAIGDEVILWGEDLPVSVVAKANNTISYEVLTRMTNRPEKVYIEV